LVTPVKSQKKKLLGRIIANFRINLSHDRIGLEPKFLIPGREI
jgi:hypothetical protein